MALPAPPSFDRTVQRKVWLTLLCWVGPSCVLIALVAGYALCTHGSAPALRVWAGALLALLALGCGMSAWALHRGAFDAHERGTRAFLGQGGVALALYCLSVIAAFGIALSLLRGYE